LESGAEDGKTAVPAFRCLVFAKPRTPIVRQTLRLICCLPLAVAACTPGAPEEPAPLAAPARPLAFLAPQQVIVAPLNRLREVDALGWTQQIPRSREFMRAFDDALEAELGARGLKTRWVYPAALVRAGRSNPSYAVDPYTIAAAPLRSAEALPGVRLADPLATQLRTMIALQESARAVLVPVDLWFDRTPEGSGVAVLRLAMVDGRVGEIRWIGDIRSAPSNTFSRDLLTSLAAHTADLIAAP
jgi:hypothetical protein